MSLFVFGWKSWWHIYDIILPTGPKEPIPRISFGTHHRSVSCHCQIRGNWTGHKEYPRFSQQDTQQKGLSRQDLQPFRYFCKTFLGILASKRSRTSEDEPLEEAAATFFLGLLTAFAFVFFPAGFFVAVALALAWTNFLEVAPPLALAAGRFRTGFPSESPGPKWVRKVSSCPSALSKAGPDWRGSSSWSTGATSRAETFNSVIADGGAVDASQATTASTLLPFRFSELVIEPCRCTWPWTKPAKTSPRPRRSDDAEESVGTCGSGGTCLLMRFRKGNRRIKSSKASKFTPAGMKAWNPCGYAACNKPCGHCSTARGSEVMYTAGFCCPCNQRLMRGFCTCNCSSFWTSVASCWRKAKIPYQTIAATVCSLGQRSPKVPKKRVNISKRCCRSCVVWMRFHHSSFR